MADYDVAISFAGEDRAVAKALANELHSRFGLRIFYDDFEQAALMGKNLTEYLIDIYSNRASFCVVLVSHAYRRKRWTQHEWRAAQARAFEEPDADYILPVRLDDAELPGLLPTVGFVHLKGLGVRRVARLINDKTADFARQNTAVRLARSLYDEGKFARALAKIRDTDFDDNVEALRIRGDCLGELGRYPEAVDALQTLRARRPSDFMASMLLGIFCFRLRRFEDAIRHYESANRIRPGHPTVTGDLAAARRYAKRRTVASRNGTTSERNDAPKSPSHHTATKVRDSS